MQDHFVRPPPPPSVNLDRRNSEKPTHSYGSGKGFGGDGAFCGPNGFKKVEKRASDNKLD